MDHLQPIEFRGDDELNLRPEEVAWLNAAQAMSRKTCGEVLDLSEAWDSVAELETMINRLKELGLYRRDLLYRGIDGEWIRAKHRQRHMQCSTEEELLSLSEVDSAYKVAIAYDLPAIIIYDGEKLELSPAICPAPTAYRLKEGVSTQDAIVAIFVLPIDDKAEEIANKRTIDQLAAVHC